MNNRVQVFRLDGTFVGKFGTAGQRIAARHALHAPSRLDSGRRLGRRVGRRPVGLPDRALAPHRHGLDVRPDDRYPIPPTTNTAVFHEPRGLAVDARGSRARHGLDPSPGRAHEPERHDREPLRRRAARATCSSTGHATSTSTTRPATSGSPTRSPTGCRSSDPTAASSPSAARPAPGRASSRGPASIAIRQSDRTAWITDTQNDRVVLWDVATKTVIAAQYGTGNPGNGPGMLNRPDGDRRGRGDRSHLRRRHDQQPHRGALGRSPAAPNIQLVRAITADFNEPEAVEVSADGTIYVADTGDSEIVMLAPRRHGDRHVRRGRGPRSPCRASPRAPTARSSCPTRSTTAC